jgi:hypothetical protein
MTDRFKEIRERAEAATEGPWEWWDSCSWRRLGVKDDYGNHVLQPHVASDGHPDVICEKSNRDFIAHSRTDIPYLLDEIAKRDALLERALRRLELMSDATSDAICTDIEKLRKDTRQ